MLKLILFLVVLVAIPIVLLAVLKRLGLAPNPAVTSDSKTDLALDYKKKDWFFTKAERSFFGVLQQIAGNQYLIFAKVRLCDVVSVSKGTGNYQSLQNKIQSKHVDFLLCSTDYVKPLVVIELDDASHDSERRKKRDAEVDAILQSAGMPIVHVKAQHSYNPADVAARLRAVIEL